MARLVACLPLLEGSRGSIPSWVIPRTLKLVLVMLLFDTQDLEEELELASVVSV